MILILAICETCRNTQEVHHLDFSSVSCSSCKGDIQNDSRYAGTTEVISQDVKDTDEELSIMKRNVREMQESLTNAHKRIKYLNDLVKP